MSVREFIRGVCFVLLLSCVACSSKQPAKESQPLSSSGDQGKAAQVEPAKPQPPAQQPAQQSAQQTPQQQKGKTVTYATNPERFVKEKTVEAPFNITNPKTADEHLSVAIFDDNKQQWDKAIEEYTKALQLRPDWALAHFRLAKDYQRTGRADDAIAQFEEATRSDPQYYEAYYHLALAYKDQGKTRQAIQAYTKFMEYPSAGVKMMGEYQLGLWYEEIGEREQASAHLESYRRLALESNTTEPHSDRFRKAVRELRKLKPSN